MSVCIAPLSSLPAVPLLRMRHAADPFVPHTVPLPDQVYLLLRLRCPGLLVRHHLHVRGVQEVGLVRPPAHLRFTPKRLR